MSNMQAIYEKCLLDELETVFLYPVVLGKGKDRIESAVGEDDNFNQAAMFCRHWVDTKLLERFNPQIFKEHAEISVKLDKQTQLNTFIIEGNTYKMLITLDTLNETPSVFLRSLLK